MVEQFNNHCRSKYLKGNIYNQSRPNEQKIAFHQARTLNLSDIKKDKKRDFAFPRHDNNKYQYVQGILINVRPKTN